MIASLSDRTLLVTGGAGFIGSHLAERLLSLGSRVVILDNFHPFYDPAIKRAVVRRILSGEHGRNCVVEETDIRDAGSLEALFRRHRPQAVFHLAALAGVRPSIERPADYFDVNVGGTVSVLETCRRNGVRDLVLASSSSVYGGSTRVPFSEKDPVGHPISPYAASKRSAELCGYTYRHLYGLRTAVLRYFTVYGPRQRPDLAVHTFTRQILRGDPISLYGDGTSSRDYTFVGDIVAGTLAAYEWLQKHDGGVYDIFNLGNSSPVTLRELVNELSSALALTPKITTLPAVPGDMQQTYADIGHARETLGWRPEVRLADGIRTFVSWFREESGL